MVAAVKRVVTGLVDHHRVVSLTNFVAQGSRHLLLATDLQAEWCRGILTGWREVGVTSFMAFGVS
jgi:hypothetical protein